MRLIDADALIKKALAEAFFDSAAEDTFCELVETAPTIDAVEVVRCKDCKYRDAEQCAMSFRDLYTGKLFSRESDIDFCSKSKRREQ